MGGVEFLNPKGFWLLSALAPLVTLYILKIRRKRAKVSSTLLWRAAERDLLAKSPFRKLVTEIPLLLQILALLLLTLALAQPTRKGSRIGSDHVAIVVDTSASMSAVEPNNLTRIQTARTAAVGILRALGPSSDAFVVEAARDGSVVQPPTRDGRALEAAIERLVVQEVEGRLAPAVALAADRLRTLGGKGRLFIITDGSLASDEAIVTQGIETQVIRVGTTLPNVGVVRLDVRSGIDSATRREQVQVFGVLRNYGPVERNVYVTAVVSDSTEPVASRRVTIPPNEKIPVILTFFPTVAMRGQGLVIHVAANDPFPVDDTAYARVPPPLRMPVTIATPAPYSWITRALDADPNLDLQKLSTDQIERVNIDDDALVFVEHACPERLRGTSFVFVAPPQGRCAGVDVGALEDGEMVTSWESSDPRLRFLSLDGVHIAKTSLLKARGQGAALVRTPRGTVVADASMPGRTVTIVGFAPGESDWPLKASFVLFVRNLVELGRSQRASGTTAQTRTGESIGVPVPPGTETASVTGPAELHFDVPARDGVAVLPPPQKTGFYRVKWKMPHTGTVLLAANLLSETESSLAQADVSTLAVKGDVTVTAGSASPTSGWATWFALLGAGVVVADILWLTKPERKSKTVRRAA